MRRVRRVRRAPTRASQAEFLLHKEAARVLVQARLAHFNAQYQFTYGRVAIKNTLSRWGSCSTKGNLNFNYRLIHLSPEQQDYVIVHELCHVKEFNHAAGFWSLVAEQCPDFQRIRTELKKMRML